MTLVPARLLRRPGVAICFLCLAVLPMSDDVCAHDSVIRGCGPAGASTKRTRTGDVFSYQIHVCYVYVFVCVYLGRRVYTRAGARVQTTREVLEGFPFGGGRE